MRVDNYIILTAMDIEAKHIKSKAEIITTGIGVDNVNRVLQENIDKLKDKTIINIGYAGSNIYPIGTVLSVNKVKRLNTSGNVKDIPYKLLAYSRPCDVCITADTFVENTESKLPIVDMELYYIRKILHNTLSIKIISDKLNIEQYMDSVHNMENAWKRVNLYLKELVEIQ